MERSCSNGACVSCGKDSERRGTVHWRIKWILIGNTQIGGINEWSSSEHHPLKKREKVATFLWWKKWLKRQELQISSAPYPMLSLSMIRNFISRNADVLKIYKTLIKSNIEYCTKA